MAKKSLFKLSEKKYPQIYAYSLNEIYPNCLKIGYTTRKNVIDRIKEQYNIEFPDGKKPYILEYKTDAIKDDGSIFDDHELHKELIKRGIINRGGEWFQCTIDDVKSAVITIKKGISNKEDRTEMFKMRQEQEKAIEKTIEYFKRASLPGSELKPHFLWNAKMRFGKTFTSYQLAKKMGWTRVLILTYKPAVENSWKDDLMNHIDFEGWQFVAKDSMQYEEIDSSKPIVCFGSFQDYLGRTEEGKIKAKNEWVHQINWDIIIFDEYHFGAWRDSAKELCTDDIYLDEDSIDEKNIPIKAKYFLYLSGTPFKAIASGEFTYEQIFNWSYSDEQKAKKEWIGENNPYESLPEILLLTYKLPEDIREIAIKGEFNEFDLNTFFKASGSGKQAKFKYEKEVQKWLDLIRGGLKETSIDQLKLGAIKPPFPFSDVDLTKILSHTVWFLPDVSACYAMANLLKQKQNAYYNKYKVIVAAGASAGVGVKAVEPVKKAMKNPLETHTITLTCGKLTTGVTIKPWTGIFMLRNLTTPETYFQAAFRVQSPWIIVDEDGSKSIVKQQCFIFDFAPNRALSQIATYCENLNTSLDISIEEKIQDFINFLPVLAYDGYAMEPVDAAGLLDIAMGRTTATLLAQGWKNTLLVNVDNDVLKSLVENQEAMDVIMSIEEFRNVKDDLDIVINKSDSIKKLEGKKTKLTSKEKKTLDEDRKIYNKKREEIREKLKHLASKMPLFMYLSDNRENTFKQLVYPLEPELFKKVTGLTHEEFELLVNLGLFNSNLMNNAIFDFRKYEEASLTYSGINKRLNEDVGGFDTIISSKELEEFLEGKLN